MMGTVTNKWLRSARPTPVLATRAAFARPVGMCVLAITILALSGSAFAAEKITYKYDTLGRLIAVDSTAGANPTVATVYSYDSAGNRTNVTVTGAVPPSTSRLVIVPLLGLSIIRTQ